jgi:hypothetical protein
MTKITNNCGISSVVCCPSSVFPSSQLPIFSVSLFLERFYYVWGVKVEVKVEVKEKTEDRRQSKECSKAGGQCGRNY